LTLRPIHSYCTREKRSSVRYAICRACFYPLFFFSFTTTTEIYTLSLHDALPIFPHSDQDLQMSRCENSLTSTSTSTSTACDGHPDRKSTRLNSSHVAISYAVFCLKKKHQLGLKALP